MEIMKRYIKSLSIQILTAAIAGIVVSSFSGEWDSYLELAGNIFLKVFQIVIVFYVVATVTGAVLIGDAQDMGRMGLHTFKWIIVFTLISAGIGAGLSIILNPGAGFSLQDSSTLSNAILESSGNPSRQNAIYRILRGLTEGSMVPFIVLAIFFGIAMGAYAKESQNKTMIDRIRKIYIYADKIIRRVLYIVPFGIFCLIAHAARGIKLDLMIHMRSFLLILLLGNLIQFVVFLPLTCYLTKTDILTTLKKFPKLSVLALTTTSGAICLPIKNEEEVVKFGISRKVADFTGPITMSMNSCGAVQCYVAAIFFLAQSTGSNLSGYQIITAIFLSILMCMGTISVPGGSAVVYAFLAASLGLSSEGIGILISIDWIAGMFRTLMNVDVDVLVGMLVASRLGELDYDVFHGRKKITYL